MTIPTNKDLSTTVDPGPFLAPRNREKEPLEDWTRGGIALNDGSAGMDVYDWYGVYEDGDFILSVPGIIAPTTVHSVDDVTEFQFSFDQNMQPVIAYMTEAGTAHFWWYDSTQNDHVTLDLPAGTTTPRCVLDDKRTLSGTQAQLSDVLLTYLRDGTLYLRVQRDRYDTEYTLATGYTNYRVQQFGMNTKFRMQWQLVPTDNT